MCCQNCYSLLQKMTVLETSFRTLLSEFRTWHSCAAQGPSACGSSDSRQRAEGLLKQRAVETHRVGPAERMDGAPNVSTADRNEQNHQWFRVGAKPKQHATYSSVVSSSAPASRAHPAKANANAPALSPRQNARAENQFHVVHLQNRFEPLKDLSELQNKRTRRVSHLKNPSRTTGTLSTATADTLVFGDDTVYGVNNRKFLVQCEPDITVSELNGKLPTLLAEHTTVKRIIVHVGKNDTRKKESEILKRDFDDLFNTLRKLNVQSFISGPLPVRSSDMFSRLFAINMWLQKRCMLNGLHFIDNFNLFFGKRDFFRRDGQHTSRMGDRFLAENVIFSLSNFSVLTSGDMSAPTPKDTVTPKPQQRQVLTAKDTVGTPEPQHPPPTENAEISEESHVPLYELLETPELHE
ncbi:hypothetical protein NFI96_005251 [Prochilodus magdalenae]|nr:hypothetical protein NFI96_005251 [Prochilodus magdalenae]